MPDGRTFSQQLQTRIRDAIVQIREQGESTFGVVSGSNGDEQARAIVLRLLNATNVTQSQFASLIGSPHPTVFNLWLNHPGERVVEGFRIIRFLYQVLYQIAEEALAAVLEQEEGDEEVEEDDESDIASATEIVGEKLSIEVVSEITTDELVSATRNSSVKDKKASVPE
ncbi:unnamed protein product, partial [Adineta steineri]